ncbi:hypothetical protein CRG98_043552 [Punica granatum]|uniref:Uncharacterized protein n=1 Tax=Punica granatum TaxID=22663 RepID=A0A2I0HWM0_PUNGR|nr:hypothetical protein CRG98_043552 [Punica granatum]
MDLFCGGLGEDRVAALLECTRFTRGNLYVRYLGLPLTSGKLSMRNCEGRPRGSRKLRTFLTQEGAFLRKGSEDHKGGECSNGKRYVSLIAKFRNSLHTKDRLMEWGLDVAGPDPGLFSAVKKQSRGTIYSSIAESHVVYGEAYSAELAPPGSLQAGYQDFIGSRP